MSARKLRTARWHRSADGCRRLARRKAFRPLVESLEVRLLLAQVNEVESNDALVLATALSLTQDPAGFFNGIGLGGHPTTDAADYWRFDANAGDRVTIAGEGGSGSNSIVIEFRNSLDQIIVQAGDTSTGRPQITNQLIATTGTYYVRTHTNSAGALLSTYTLRTDVSRGLSAETEANNTTATASAVALTPGPAGHAVGRASGNVTTSADLDYFNLGNLRAGDLVDLSISKPANSTLDPRIQLIQATTGAVLTTATGSGHLTLAIPTDGIYYAQVAANTAATAGMQALYVLTADVSDAAAPSVLSSTLPTALQSGKAVTFDGLNDYVVASDSPSLRPTNLTIEGWVNFSSLAGVKILFGKSVGAGGFESYTVWLDGTSLRAIVGDASGDGPLLSTTWAPTLGTWYHVAYTFSDSTDYQALYIDGALVTSGVVTKSIGYDTRPFMIGAQYDNNIGQFYFPGVMDEVRLWNTARSQVQIQADMSRVLAGNEAGLAAYWRFEEGTGTTTADATANGNTATLDRGPVWTTGNLSGGLAFDEANDYVTVPDSPPLHPGNITAEGWFQINNNTAAQAFITKPLGSGINDSFALWYESGQLRGVMADAIGGATSVAYNWVPAPVPNTWYHLAYTFDDATNTQRLFLNGAPVATNTTTKSPAYDSHPVLIGADNDNGVYNLLLSGKADDVRIWNVARSGAEILASKNAPLTGSEANLVGYWKLDDGAGVTAADSTANGSHGTLIGGGSDWTANAAPLTASLAPRSWYPGEGNASDKVGGNHGAISGGLLFDTGEVGQAFRFDGVDDAVDLGPWFNLQSFSVEMWINPAATQVAFADIIDNNHTSGVNWVVQQDSTTTNRYIFGGGTAAGDVAFNLTANTWQHLALTRDVSGFKQVYINGILVGSAQDSPLQYNGQQFLRLGRWGGGGRNWKGALDEVSFFDRALSSREIESIAQLGSAGKPLPPTVTTAIDGFTATFSEDLLPSAATAPANFSLREAGNNGTFGDGDDSIYVLTPTYAGLGSRTVSFAIAPNPLQPGKYRFQTLPGVTDRAGNSLTAFTRDFASTLR